MGQMKITEKNNLCKLMAQQKKMSSNLLNANRFRRFTAKVFRSRAQRPFTLRFRVICIKTEL